jgi:hypothetical protein
MSDSQYVPRITEQDISRIVNRDFPEHERAAVLSLLSAYGQESGPDGRARVHAAILKLSAGNVDRVCKYLKVAQSDFRDVLWPAESPLSWKVGFGASERMTASAVERDDREQYLEWLKRPAP